MWGARLGPFCAAFASLLPARSQAAEAYQTSTWQRYPGYVGAFDGTAITGSVQVA
eukprot:CAMPEP_0197927546 /NCGR_PEP_ID=MMETSP1439-20131203/100883_1 /TAXON_ID=66791 /ORGANISM="Gonyaulax spinifera, Strain CCMP409" /LENGTH=54 /DNA_ID=CAMNT_0043550123 /DNA_START=45 /DNA_END=206 /DNA_ORIENTATION=+